MMDGINHALHDANMKWVNNVCSIHEGNLVWVKSRHVRTIGKLILRINLSRKVNLELRSS